MKEKQARKMCGKNTHIFMSMEKAFDENGFHSVSAGEIKTKIGVLSKQYREEKRRIGGTGGSPSEWKYYEMVHKIIGSHAFNNLSDRINESYNHDSTNTSLSSDDIFSDGQPSPFSPCPSSTDENSARGYRIC
uniref:CSON012469 protein n=2 Tax=Culicoides sonorensis TaxID=179676 RepID=A0A336KQB6_CULSO